MLFYFVLFCLLLSSGNYFCLLGGHIIPTENACIIIPSPVPISAWHWGVGTDPKLTHQSANWKFFWSLVDMRNFLSGWVDMRIYTLELLCLSVIMRKEYHEDKANTWIRQGWKSHGEQAWCPDQTIPEVHSTANFSVVSKNSLLFIL